MSRNLSKFKAAINCDREDRKIFLGFKFSISGFFLGRDFIGYSKQSTIPDSYII